MIVWNHTFTCDIMCLGYINQSQTHPRRLVAVTTHSGPVSSIIRLFISTKTLWKQIQINPRSRTKPERIASITGIGAYGTRYILGYILGYNSVQIFQNLLAELKGSEFSENSPVSSSINGQVKTGSQTKCQEHERTLYWSLHSGPLLSV